MSAEGVLNTDINTEPLRQHILTVAKAEGVTIDADMVLLTLERWVGWYRMESEARTPKEQLSDADEIVTQLAKLRELMQPHNMNPDFRAHLQENMRALGVVAPDWSRLEACARDTQEKLRKPRQGERIGTEPKYRAIHETYNAIREYSKPAMGVESSAALAAELVRDAADVRVPTGRDELREITRGR